MTRQGTRQPATTPVGANLRAARNERGWTQKQVADAIGVAPADVSRWERGKVEPGIRNRFALADLFFGGDVADIYRVREGAAA